MGKSRYSKIELAMQRLQITDGNIDALADFIASKVNQAKINGLQVNVISGSMVIEIIYLFTKVLLIPSNLSNYKSCGVDLLNMISDRLSIPVFHSARCNVTLNEGRVVLSPSSNGAVYALLKIIKDGLTNRGVRAIYSIWRDSGKMVGEKRNWPDASFVELCHRKKFELKIPISHDKPTMLHRILNKLYLNYITGVELVSNDDFNNLLLKTCTEEVVCRRNSYVAWLPNFVTLPKVKYVESIFAVERYKPYIYCKKNGHSTKIGKAENADRFKKDNIGLVICFHYDNNQSVFNVEQEILRRLEMFDLYPVTGTIENFDVPLESLCILLLEICSTTPCIYTKVRSITATIRYKC